MGNTRNIGYKFAGGSTVFSVEFFPPKTEDGARQILRAANKLKDLAPDYVSITYGAGGSTRERTLEYGELLREIFKFEVMPHLVCLGHSKGEIMSVLKRYESAGLRNVMALRGDPPKGESDFKPHPDGFRHASELVAFIRENFPDFGIGCAGYPEKHPEAPSLEKDIDYLKLKVDAGADFVVTQLFFDNSHYFSFVEKCLAAGIDKPIIAGILPALSFKQAMNFKNMCAADIPLNLLERLESAASDDDAVKVGIEWAESQIEELKQKRVPGIHLYILNRAQSALALASKIRA